MELTRDQLEAEALKLPTEDRALLAERLVESLAPDRETERTWLPEVKRRLKQLYNGEVSGIPAQEASKRARTELRRRS